VIRKWLGLGKSEGRSAKPKIEPHYADLFREYEVFESDRLILGPLQSVHAAGILELDADEEICQLSLSSKIETLAQARDRITAFQNYAKNGLAAPWAVVVKETGQFIGTCGVTQFDEEARTFQIGYSYIRKAWNQGYGTEALVACNKFLFENSTANRIECHCWPQNQASRRVMEKAGMSFEGILREARISPAGLQDACVYSVLRRDWDNRTTT